MSPLEPKQPEAPDPKGTGSPQGSQQGSEQSVVRFSKEKQPEVLPSLFGAGQGIYQARPENFVLSFFTHTAGLALLLWLFHVTVHPIISTPTISHPIELTDYVMKIGKGGPSGGGGGDASKLKASTGAPPRAAKEQFTPPVVIQRQQSKLMMEPTVVADLKVPQTSQIGDPLSKLMTSSNGVGVGGGIGSGDGGGVGSGHGGPGVGPGIFHLGENGVSAPKPLYTPEPEFSEEARKAKYQGVVTLDIVVGPDGRVHNAKVVHSLGMGLDEKAIETVRTWKFDPAKKDGRAVACAFNVEVDFHLY